MHTGSTSTISLTADPLRPSAGRASPDPATSDTLCRSVGASAGPPHPAFAPERPVFRQGMSVSPRGQSPAWLRPVMGDVSLELRMPYRRFRSRSFDRVVLRVPDAFPRNFPHPFARSIERVCVKTRRWTAATAWRLGQAFGAWPRCARRRCFSPTSATDSDTSTRTIARFPGAQLAPR